MAATCGVSKCPDREDEIYRAAVWARARIEANGSARVGIVVPELSEYRSVVMRIFSSVMEPDVRSNRYRERPRRTLPFNASLGQPFAPTRSSALHS